MKKRKKKLKLHIWLCSSRYHESNAVVNMRCILKVWNCNLVSILEMCARVKVKSRASSIFYYRFTKNYRLYRVYFFLLSFIVLRDAASCIISIVFNGILQRNMLLQWIFTLSARQKCMVTIIKTMRVRDVKMKSFKDATVCLVLGGSFTSLQRLIWHYCPY